MGANPATDYAVAEHGTRCSRGSDCWRDGLRQRAQDDT